VKKKFALRLVAFCLTLGLLCTGAAAETATNLDYTVEEKMVKQLQAGSGFEGTLTLEAEAVAGREGDAVTTIRPMTFNVRYIYVRADETQNTDAESRLTLALVNDEEETLGSAELSLKSGVTALTSTLLGDGWYLFDRDAAAADETAGAAVGDWLGQTALPGLTTFAAGLLGRLYGPETVDLTDLAEPYLTRIDLWLEGYRQSALLGKTDDGTTTMEIDYDIPASAVKAQLKQMVMDLLADDELTAALAEALPAGDVTAYLDPSLQSYYFYAIDELPLNGDVTISRTVSLTGETLALSLLLPYYDSQSGAATLRYDRSQGEGDQPEENVIELAGRNVLVRAQYQTYDTLTGTTVYQGTVLRRPQSAEGDAKAFSAAFTLSSACGETTNGQGQSSMTRDIRLTLEPEYTPDDADDDTAAPTEKQAAEYVTFTPLEITLNTDFTSGQAKNASTAVDLVLTVSGEELAQTFKLTFTGKTKGKWTPDAFNAREATQLSGMDAAALKSLWAQAGVKAGLLLLPYVSLPAAEATETPTVEATETPAVTATETATPEPTATPAVTATETATPEATETPAVTATETATPEATEIPTVTATGTPTPEPTATPAVTATETATPEATETPAAEPTETATAEAADTPTPEPTATPAADAP